MVLGTLWSGVIFGKKWLQLMKKKKEDFKSENYSIYIITFADALVSSAMLAFIIFGLGISGWYNGLISGVLVWIGIGSVALHLQKLCTKGERPDFGYSFVSINL